MRKLTTSLFLLLFFFPYYSICRAAAPAAASAAEVPSPAERELFENLNRERLVNHLSPLKWDPALATAARAHSDRMAREEKISHHFPDEMEFSERILKAGARYSKIAENVGEGPSLLEIHVGWMHSPGHRANILDPDLNSIGIGVTERNFQFFATQDFSRAIETLSIAEQERRFGEALQAAGLTLARDPTDARKACETGHAETSGKYAVYEFHYTTSDLSELPDQLDYVIHRGQYHTAAVGACDGGDQTRTGMYKLSVLLY